MAHIIAVTNQKGGVGKTTTSINLSACLADNGKRTLLIDMDPQGNATSGLGIDKENLEGNLYDCLIEHVPFAQVVQKTAVKKLSLMPATMDVAGAAVELVTLEHREQVLKQALQAYLDSVKKPYDFVLIDCPPSLGLLTINALVAADQVLIPVQCEFYALEGLAQLMQTVEMVRSSMNEQLRLLGLVLTMFDGRTNLSLQVAEEVKKYFSGQVFHTLIPRNVRLGEAPSHGEPITIYDSHSRGADVYRKLAREVIRRVG
ncbi:ParA family protein [Megasphaera hominis]|uniref:ParA family protein n=1 Tax=Megasphaera hominis TaxID=159836 RepID=A0ABR6VGU3_9FIRM|nr:ParA family protein [Megasphaera hominis]MBC3536303.1 ParA family protein [Megasphaera hominis]